MLYNYAELCKIRNQAEAQQHVSNSGNKTLESKKKSFLLL